jgi:predicted O-linked N-acetylglucosamine transferase (SPINDLY family)
MAHVDDDRTLQTAHGLRRSGKLNEAAALYRELIEKNSDNFHALHFLGVAEASTGNFALAKQHMARSLAIRPPNIQFMENYATILFQSGDTKTALDACQEGLELDAASVTLVYVSALCCFKLGEFRDALTRFDRLLSLQPKHVVALYERSAVLTAMKDYEAALRSVDQALALDPRYVEAHLSRAFLCGELKRRDDAVAAYDKALALRPDLASAWLARGNLLYDLARYDDALASYDKALALSPGLAVAWFGRGNALFLNGQHDTSLAAYDRALGLKPDFAEAWLGRGNILAQTRQQDDAAEAYDKALAVNPKLAEAWLGCGNVRRELGRHDEALAAYDRALTLKPGLAGAWLGRGNALCQQKNYDEALAAYDQALALHANMADAWLGRGYVFSDLERHNEALAAHEKGLELNPDFAEGWLGLGNVLDSMRHHGGASSAYDRALMLKPDLAGAWLGRGNACSEFGQYDDALTAYDRAMALKPGFAEVWFGRGRTYSRMSRPEDALAAQDKALALKPDFPEAWLGRAVANLDLNREQEALTSVDKALAVKPSFRPAISYRIFLLDFAHGVGIAEQQEARRHWWREVGAKIAAQSSLSHNNSRDPKRRIKVGYVSGDFRLHSAALSFRPMVQSHDKSQVDITCYSTSIQEDDFTNDFRSAADRWRNIVQLSDDEFCKQVQDDQIDILIDLSGHTAGDRLAAFARKPAPIQISMGATGTGLPTIDYLLSHPVICPPEIRPYFAETVVDLPSIMTIEALPNGLKVSDPPVLSKGFITFGVFNRATKLSEDVVALWSRILDAVPRSRVLMKHYGFDDPERCKRIVDKFAQHGIAADRIAFLGATSRSDHLAAFKDVDISLDTFPHNGGISTLESLQMGVPVVAMLGQAISSRAAGAILASIGLDDWVANDTEGYLAIAAKFAAMPDHLKTLRYALPGMLLACAAGNPTIYTKALEDTFRRMWVDYCRTAA